MLYQVRSQEFPMNIPLQLWMFGVNHLQDAIHRPLGVPYFQWFYCVKGEGELIIDHQRSIISEGQGFLIYPDTAHVYQPLTEDWTLHIIAFQGNLCTEILQNLQMNVSGSYYFSNPEIFEEHIHHLLEIQKSRKPHHSLRFSKECYSFLLDISQCITHFSQYTSAEEDIVISAIINYLNKHYASPIGLDELAALVNLSKDYMCARFKAATGQTIIHYLTMIRIGHARQFLHQYPEKRVVEIASMCGFESPSYFGKIFKKEIGMTPENYRKNQ